MAMKCDNCGAALSPVPGEPQVKCGFCGVAATVPIAERVAAVRGLEDRNQNGIPDVFEPAAADIAARMAPRPSLDNIPPAPREPSARARRLVFGYQGSQGARLLIGLIFTAIGLVITLVMGWGLPTDLGVAMFGSTVKGTVTGMEVQSHVRINKRNPTLIRYKYRVDGESYEGSSSTLNRGMVATLKTGAAITVEYIPFAPSFSRAEGSTASTMGYASLFFMIFLLVGAPLALSAYRSNRREIRAFRYGTPALAVVTFRGRDTTVKVNGRNPTKVEWELTVDGKGYTGSISHMDPSELRDLMGEEIVVLYDPGNPSVNTVYVN